MESRRQLAIRRGTKRGSTLSVPSTGRQPEPAEVTNPTSRSRRSSAAPSRSLNSRPGGFPAVSHFNDFGPSGDSTRSDQAAVQLEPAAMAMQAEFGLPSAYDPETVWPYLEDGVDFMMTGRGALSVAGYMNIFTAVYNFTLWQSPTDTFTGSGSDEESESFGRRRL
jgi:hypothetical protein